MEVCGICGEEFETREAYLDHACSTGYKPSEFEHQVSLDPNYVKISEAALERGSQQS